MIRQKDKYDTNTNPITNNHTEDIEFMTHFPPIAHVQYTSNIGSSNMSSFQSRELHWTGSTLKSNLLQR